jgi:dTDP-glucose 4,6-dehydratase
MSNDIDIATNFKIFQQLCGEIHPLLAAYPLPELKGKSLFITGSTGFIGYWLLLTIHCLNQNGASISVRALSRDPVAFLERHPEIREMEWLQWSQGDIRNYEFPSETIDAIIHAATDTSPAAAENPEEFCNSIVSGTRHVLDHAIKSHTKRILFLSSGTVYGEQKPDLERIKESSPFKNAFNVNDGYLQGKRLSEGLVDRYSRHLKTVIARCFTFVGHGLPTHLAIAQFIRAALNHDNIFVHSDGKPLRSFLYAADMCIWLLALLAKGKSGQAYNVGSPEAYTLAETASLVRDKLSPEKLVIIQHGMGRSARHSYIPDVRKAEKELGLRVWTSLPQAILQTAASRQQIADM